MRGILTCLVAVPLASAAMGAAPPANNSTQIVRAIPIRPATLQSAQKPAKAIRKTSKLSEKPYAIGKASWYGRQFHGKKTASGEPFNMFNLTAAHRKLPLGTWLKVTNLRNGQSVVVRVNDRGPVPESRIIDLSFEAATLLDLRAHGVEKVRLDLVKPETVALALNVNQLQ